MRKIFKVKMHNQFYDVYDIPNKEHPGYNGEPKTWWLHYGRSLPGDLDPPVDSQDWVPYHTSINRRLWDIRFTQRNTSKVKWDEHQFSNTTVVEMRCNDQLIYSFSTTGNDGGLSFAMAKVQYLKIHLAEFPGFDFFDPKSNDRRKIYWFGLPATVVVWRKDEPWLIGIKPDYTCGLNKEQWWKELKSRQKLIPPKEDDIDIWEDSDEEDDFINWGDALSDQHIDWFRG